jgi:uncharacterized protein (TIGR00645 family)
MSVPAWISKQHPIARGLGSIVFSSRWLLYPINLGLLSALMVYIGNILNDDWQLLRHPWGNSNEALMVILIGFVDMAMVANLVLMISQGNQQIFISKFVIRDDSDRPQWLDHIDSGILKVKMALSIAGITLIRILKDFVDLDKVEWPVVVHRVYIHVVCLFSALMMALIWRLTHPNVEHK